MPESTRKLEATLQNIGDGVIVVDGHQVISMINPVAEKIIGIKTEKTIGQRYDQVFRLTKSTNRRSRRSFVEIVLHSGQIFHSSSDTIISKKNGYQIPVDFSAAPVMDVNKKPTGCVIVFRDVRKARAVDRAKSEFVSLASHQLKTPLAAVKWNAEMLLAAKGKEFTDKHWKYLDRVYRGNQRMIQLVNALLNVSRLELGTFSVNPTLVDLKKVIKGVIEDVEPERSAKQLRLTVRHQLKTTKLKVDENLIRIIIENLVSNAVKYTPKKGSVRLTTKEDSKGIYLTVADSGYGIPPDQQRNIFTKFHRADNVRELGIQGTGLGLYMVKFILDTVGGDITFSSELGKGSTFTVCFPLRGMRKRLGDKTLI
ncbi:MAG: ATP-binding protein [Patescibacteria group bacterium]